jgi:hypothetical protein
MDKIMKMVISIDLNNIVKGVLPDLSLLNEGQLTLILHLLLHCCLNGPVGVNKDTSWPTGEKGSIKALIKLNISNRSWQRLAFEFATALMEVKEAATFIETCQQVSLNKKLWPLNKV